MTAPSRVAPGPPVFYGWVVLMASVAIIAVGTGTIFSLAVFLRPLEEEFGWTRSLISGVAFVNWVIFGVGSFVWGASQTASARGGLSRRRRPPRRGPGRLQPGPHGRVSSTSHSASSAPSERVRSTSRSSATATRWFAARRGLAMGIISSGMGLGIFVVPPTARALITALGWRATFALFGGLAWIVGGVAVRYLVNRPEDRGLQSYGADPPRRTRARRRPAAT